MSKKREIFIQMKVTVDLDNEDLEDALTYLPEKLTAFVTREDVILENKLYDEDIKILNKKGEVISIDNILADDTEKGNIEIKSDKKGEHVALLKAFYEVVHKCKKINLYVDSRFELKKNQLYMVIRADNEPH